MPSISTPTPVLPAPRRDSRWKHFLKRTLQTLAGLVVLLLIVGATYEFIAQRMDARRFPQQGKSIALGPEFHNVNLNLDCSGPGPAAGAASPAVPVSALPTVILESGGSVPAIGWRFVQDEVAKFTRVCSYDRAGYGWSGAGPLPRTSLQIAKELHALLVGAGEKGPFVMVGHSLGGINVRVYTGLYPRDVVGVVLVDASHEDQLERVPPSMRALTIPPSDKELTLANILLYLGITRALSGESSDDTLPQEFVRQLSFLQRSAKFNAAVASEIRSFAQSAEQVRAAGNLGDRPLVVLTAGKRALATDFPKGITGITQKDLDEYQKMWVDEIQVREMRLSTRGKRTIVVDSGHLIPFERPDAVTAAIREVCEMAKAPH